MPASYIHSYTRQYRHMQYILAVIVFFYRFFSLQASEPLTSDDVMRMEIESRICSEEGPRPDTYNVAQEWVYHSLQQVAIAIIIELAIPTCSYMHARNSYIRISMQLVAILLQYIRAASLHIVKLHAGSQYEARGRVSSCIRLTQI